MRKAFKIDQLIQKKNTEKMQQATSGNNEKPELMKKKKHKPFAAYS